MWTGPWRIIEFKTTIVVIVQHEKTHKKQTVHVDRLVPCHNINVSLNNDTRERMWNRYRQLLVHRFAHHHRRTAVCPVLTSHNWLSPRDEHVTQNLCQSTVKERLGKYVKYKAFPFFILIYFFPGLAYWSDPWTDFHTEWLKLRAITQGSAFLGSAGWPKTFKGPNSPKTVTIGR